MNLSRKFTTALLLLGFATSNAMAQFVGPGERGDGISVAQAAERRPGSDVTVTGNIVAHLEGEKYRFRDESGDIRIEVEHALWQGREVRPGTRVRLRAEVDFDLAGRYLWVESLEVLEAGNG